MKSFSFFATMMVTSIAMAYPAVNDKVEYRGVYTPAPGLGAPIHYTQSLEIVAADASTGGYTMRTSQTINGGAARTADQQIGPDEVPTEAQVADLLSQCAKAGGVSGSVTVAKGTFASCALPQENGGTVWIGNVPFGVLKVAIVDGDGNRNEAELTDFVLGK